MMWVLRGPPCIEIPIRTKVREVTGKHHRSTLKHHNRHRHSSLREVSRTRQETLRLRKMTWTRWMCLTRMETPRK